MNVLAIYKTKTKEMYAFHYDYSKASHTALMATLGLFASDATLSFTWYDAAILSQKADRMRNKHELAPN